MNEKAFLVLSIKELRKILRAATVASKASSAHPGKVVGRYCLVFETEILGPEHNSADGMRHLNSGAFMDSVPSCGINKI
jgi:hypothetical protein